jgi:hypothetical protein
LQSVSARGCDMLHDTDRLPKARMLMPGGFGRIPGGDRGVLRG